MKLKYRRFHKSSSTKGKCSICGKVSGTFLEFSRTYTNDVQFGTSATIPLCDDCYNCIGYVDENEIIDKLNDVNKLLNKIKKEL